MERKEKEYTVVVTHRGREREVTGTLEYLIDYFGYTLEVGHSYNNKINTQPKTIKSFISNVNKAIDEKMAGCFDRDYVELKA